MNSLSSRTTLVAALTALLAMGAACNKEKTPAAGGHSALADLPPDAAVVTYTGGKVTAGDLDAQIKPKLKQLDAQKQELRKQTAEQMGLEAIVKAEAKKSGLTEDQYFKRQIDDTIPAPTDAQIQEFFDKAKAQGQVPPEVTLDKVRDQVAQAVNQEPRREKARVLFEQLKKQYDLKVTLPEPPVERVTVEATGPAKGPAGAKVTIVEFSDFQCPFCGKAHDTVDEMMQAYAGKVRLVFRQFPLSFHPNAQKAAEASLCALDQGKFWELHDVMFKNQQKLTVPELKEAAKGLGLDDKKFADCLDGGGKAKLVDVDQKAGTAAGVSGTPAFFINGVMLSGAQPLEEFKKVIDQELASAK